MNEYGIFQDGGCIEAGFYSEAAAREVIASRYAQEDGIYVAIMCPNAEHEGQEAEHCEFCNSEDES